MARDYQKKPAARAGKAATSRARSPARKRAGLPGWLWMLGGFLPGLFLAALVHLHHQDSGSGGAPGNDLSRQAGAVGSSQDGPGNQGNDNRPRFEFYQLLSEMEVMVPDEAEAFIPRGSTIEEPAAPAPLPPRTTPTSPARTAAPATPPPAVSAAQGGLQYMLQAGSFRNAPDADRMKARLALLGVESRIQSVVIEGGQTWHRVRIGPFASRDRVDTVRERLQQEKVDSILLQVQG